MAATSNWCSSNPTQPLVEFRSVSFASEEKVVLDNISFTVHCGETRILLGRSGAGKSVILKLANGLLEPDSGQVFLFGKDLASLSPGKLFALRDAVGMVFQEGGLFDSLSVRENVGYHLTEKKVPAPEIEERVVEALRFVDMESSISRFPPELSGGMQRRVAFARAIIGAPELLLYDSPTGGLDPVTSDTIIRLVIKQRDVRATTSLLVTQRLQDAFTCATHRFEPTSETLVKLPDGQENKKTTFLVLEEGKIIFDGAVLDLVHSKNKFIEQFLELPI